MPYNNNQGYRGGNRQSNKTYCGGLQQEWKQGRNGQFESNRGWFSLRQAFEAAYGQHGWQQIQQMLQSLQQVMPNVVRTGNNGDMYIKFDMSKRQTPSQTGDTHSLSVNTYVAQQAPQGGGYGQPAYQQPHQHAPQQPPYPPQQNYAPPVQHPPQQRHGQAAGAPAGTPAGGSHFPYQQPGQQYAPQSAPQQAFQHEQSIPGLDDTQTAGGYPTSWDDVN